MSYVSKLRVSADIAAVRYTNLNGIVTVFFNKRLNLILVFKISMRGKAHERTTNVYSQFEQRNRNTHFDFLRTLKKPLVFCLAQ